MSDLSDVEDKIYWVERKVKELAERIIGDKLEVSEIVVKIEEIKDAIGDIEEDKKQILRRLNELSDEIN